MHKRLKVYVLCFYGAVAQLVEQRTENPCVGGSTPPRPTTNGNLQIRGGSSVGLEQQEHKQFLCYKLRTLQQYLRR